MVALTFSGSMPESRPGRGPRASAVRPRPSRPAKTACWASFHRTWTRASRRRLRSPAVRRCARCAADSARSPIIEAMDNANSSLPQRVDVAVASANAAASALSQPNSTCQGRDRRSSPSPAGARGRARPDRLVSRATASASAANEVRRSSSARAAARPRATTAVGPDRAMVPVRARRAPPPSARPARRRRSPCAVCSPRAPRARARPARGAGRHADLPGDGGGVERCLPLAVVAAEVGRPPTRGGDRSDRRAARRRRAPSSRAPARSGRRPPRTPARPAPARRLGARTRPPWPGRRRARPRRSGTRARRGASSSFDA